MRRLLSWTLLSWAVASLLVVGIVAAPVRAEDKPKPTPEEAFKKLDKDADGKLSETEFVGKREGEKADKAKERFKKLDSNSDGSLSLDEFKAGVKTK